MFSNEEEEVNIILGDALLSLFEEDADISAEALSAMLKRMLEAEPDDARRQVIREAVRQTECLSDSGNSQDGDEEVLPTGLVLPWPGKGH